MNLALFIDFKKAFDLINPRLLFLKLFHYGFDNNSLALLTDYIKDNCIRLKNYFICLLKSKFNSNYKAFIQPNFDYCSSLAVYLNKSLLNRIGRFYNFCLFRLTGISLPKYSLIQ